MELDPRVRSNIKVLIRVPNWLGGARTVQWIMCHRWALAIIFYVRNPLIWMKRT